MQVIRIDSTDHRPPTHANADPPPVTPLPDNLPDAKAIHVHPSLRKVGLQDTVAAGDENASLMFIGTATTILEWEGLRIMTDPNFLHAGDHVHLGPGVNSQRITDPAVNLEDLPRIDLILLSHYHADHFDEKVEASLRRDLPIITTPHAASCLTSTSAIGGAFDSVTALDVFETAMVDVLPSRPLGSIQARHPMVKVTAMPGKHVPSGGMLEAANEFLGAVPPTNGWMVELGFGEQPEDASFQCGYRIYISGDTLMVDDLKEIPQRYKDKQIDLMLIHLGGTTIPSPKLPLLMVTMDAQQGLQLVQLINPDVTIPIHYNDYDVFASPLDDFKKAMEEAGLSDKVVYLDHKDSYKFRVKQ